MGGGVLDKLETDHHSVRPTEGYPVIKVQLVSADFV